MANVHTEKIQCLPIISEHLSILVINIEGWLKF